MAIKVMDDFQNPRKRKRRAHRKKGPSWLVSNGVNMAEGRREIVTALHLRRSSSNFDKREVNRVKENSFDYNINKSSITSSIPIPEPTWSTTAPALLASQPSFEVLEFEWPENNLASSYNWWFGFLRSLDSKISTSCSPEASSSPHHSFQDSATLLFSGNLDSYENCEGGSSKIDMIALDQNDQRTFPDEWLASAAAEDEVELIY